MIGLVVAALISSLVAFFVGRGFRSPSQVAASAAAPRASIITAPIRRARLEQDIVLRGTLKEVEPLHLSAPAPPAGDLPVVTALSARPGELVENGGLIMAVAERPLIALDGVLPAFRTLRYGEAGRDVVELRNALAELGLTSVPDPPGRFGFGTSAAVRKLYARVGYSPMTEPVPVRVGRRRVRDLPTAMIPLGEVAFVSHLPRAVVRVRIREDRPVADRADAVELGSGRIALSIRVDGHTRAELHVGQSGVAVSDIDGRRIKVRLVSRDHSSGGFGASAGLGGRLFDLRMVPIDAQAAGGLVGQNLSVRFRSSASAHRGWIVPLASVATSADGVSRITVRSRRRFRRISVRIDAANVDSESVMPLHAALHAGEQVVVSG